MTQSFTRILYVTAAALALGACAPSFDPPPGYKGGYLWDNGQSRSVTVGPGDTMYAISRRYDVPIPPFQYAYQPALAKAYAEQKPDKLPFTFGYQFHDYRDERSNVMVARGPVVEQRAGGDANRGMSLRSSGKLDR